MFNRRNLDAYRKTSMRAELSVADPYVITKMLFQGAFERLMQARGAIEHGDLELKGTKLASASTIIESLRNTLDFNVNADLAQHLFDLYTYIIDRIADASIDVDLRHIDAALQVLIPLKNAWDSIPISEQQKAAMARQHMQGDNGEVKRINSLASGAV